MELNADQVITKLKAIFPVMKEEGAQVEEKGQFVLICDDIDITDINQIKTGLPGLIF